MLNLLPTATMAPQPSVPWSLSMQFVTCEQGILMIDTGYHIIQQLNQNIVHDFIGQPLCNNRTIASFLSQSQTPQLQHIGKTVTNAAGSLQPNLDPQMQVTMNMNHQDTAVYLAVLVGVNIFYLSLIFLLTWLVVTVRNNQEIHEGYSQSRKLCLVCKLVTAVIFLLHISGFAGATLPTQAIRLFYHGSGLFLCVAYTISLYQWIFIVMRVDFYGGKFGTRDFKKRVRKSKRTYTGVSLIIFACTLALIVVEAFLPAEQITQTVSIFEMIEYSALLLTFIITGSMIIRNLNVYFKNCYDKQRHTMLAALLLTIFSMLILLLRYSLEYWYNGDMVEIGEHSNPEKVKISITACLLVILISDLLPIITQMLCIWISSKGKWDNLISGLLSKSTQDTDTYAGSVILDNLRDELAQNDANAFPSYGESLTEYRSGYFSDPSVFERSENGPDADSFFAKLAKCEVGRTKLDSQVIEQRTDASYNQRRSNSDGNRAIQFSTSSTSTDRIIDPAPVIDQNRGTIKSLNSKMRYSSVMGTHMISNLLANEGESEFKDTLNLSEDR